MRPKCSHFPANDNGRYPERYRRGGKKKKKKMIVEYNGMTCVVASGLVNRGIITFSQYKHYTHRKQIHVVRYGGGGHPALVEYATMPTRLKEEVMRVCGDPEAAARKLTFGGSVKKDGAAVKYYAAHRFENPDTGMSEGLKPERQAEYVNNASVLNAIGTAQKSMADMHAAKGCRVSGFWEKAAGWVAGCREEWPNSLPENPRRLREKYDAYMREGYASLIHRGFQNVNRQKIDDAVGNALIRLYGNACPKLTFEEVAEKYNTQLYDILGGERLTVATIKNFLNRPECRAKWYGSRHGEVQAMNDIMPIARRRKVSESNNIWSIDGTPVQMYYKDGGRLYSNLYMYVVTDAASSAIIGYALGTSENSGLVLNALRDAMERQMYAPVQLQYDNASANTQAAVQALMGNMSEVAFPCQPYRARAKYVEAIQGHFQTAVQRLYPNFKGGNITARSLDSRINPDEARKIKQCAPTLEGLKRQAAEAVETWNNTAHKRDKYGIPQGMTPMQKYESAADKNKRLSFFDIQMLYVVEIPNRADAKGRYTYGQRGVEMVVDGQKHYFIVPDNENATTHFNFSRYNQGERFMVKMNVKHPQVIKLYKDGKHIADAVDMVEISAGIADARKYGDGHNVREFIAGARAWSQDNKAAYSVAMTGTDGAVGPLTLGKGDWNRQESDAIDDLNWRRTAPSQTDAPTIHEAPEGNRLADDIAARFGIGK